MACSAASAKARYMGKIAGLTGGASAEKIILSMFEAVFEEIVANSELVPVTKDSGTAGAGIITGKVK